MAAAGTAGNVPGPLEPPGAVPGQIGVDPAQPPPDRTCAFRWAGSRPEVVDSSVIHVCARADDHGGPHGCGCGALACLCGHQLVAHTPDGCCAECGCEPW